MASRPFWKFLPLAFVLGAAPVAAQGQLTTQDSASKQPTLPTPMPNLTVPVSGSGGAATAPTKKSARRATPRHRHIVGTARVAEPFARPALANVELTEPLPHPPQPPHVTVPVPAYPFEDLVAAYTAPPPPIVCRPTRFDRFQPDYRLVDERPVLCTADNP